MSSYELLRCLARARRGSAIGIPSLGGPRSAPPKWSTLERRTRSAVGSSRTRRISGAMRRSRPEGCGGPMVGGAPPLSPADLSRARRAGAAENQVFLLIHEGDELRSGDV